MSVTIVNRGSGSSSNTNVLVSLRRRTSVYTDGSTVNFTADGDALDFSSTGAATSSSQGIALNHGTGVLLRPSGVNAFGLTANLNYNTVKNLSFLFVGAPERITNERFWFGLSDQTTGTMVGSDNPAGNYAAFRFSTIASDTTYQCITKDNTTQTITNSGVTPVAYNAGAGPGVLFSIVFVPTAGAVTSIQFYINSTLVATNTTHLPNSGVAVGVKIAIGGNPTTNNTNAGIFFEQIYVEQDSY